MHVLYCMATMPMTFDKS